MRFRLALFVAAASGFVALSYEILWYRLYSFVTQGSAITFGVLLGFYLIGIAVGSYRSRLYCEGHSLGDQKATLRALGLFLFLANLTGFLVAPAMGWIVTIGPWSISLLIVVIATALLGAVLPLVSHLAIPPDDQAGARLSYLYLSNIFGSSAGSLLTGFVAMDRLSTRQIAVALALLGFALAGVVLLAAERRGARARGSLGALVLAGLIVALSSHRVFDQLYERFHYGKDFKPDKHFASLVENRSGLITVTDDGRVWGGGVYDGAFSTSLTDDPNGIFRAFAVGALHPRAKDVLMIGLASGSWAKVLAAAPGLERFTIVEINPGYLELIAAHPDVAGILHDPKITIVIDDGRRWLLSHPGESFDAVVMNTTWHWRAHATNLLSLEFFELARKHLRSGGLFYFNATGSIDACRTASAAFPYNYRVANFVAASDAPLDIEPAAWKSLLEAYRIDDRAVIDPATENGRRTEAWLEASFDPALSESRMERDESLRKKCAAGEVITDDNMLPEWKNVLRWGKR